MIILDTNVLSELLRPAPEAAVAAWMKRQPRPEVFTTAINQAEILYGIELMPAGRRRQSLMQAVETIFAVELAGRVLVFDSAAALAFATIAARRRSLGRPISHPDAQIAAIVQMHNATLATCDTRDFENCGVRLVDPWSA